MFAVMMFKLVAFVLLMVFAAVNGDCDYYDDGDCVIDPPSCVFSNCRPPKCSCFGEQPNMDVDDRPQFVMLTFDGAITEANMDTYRTITKGLQNWRKENIRLTFFVNHEYNDYYLTNQLYSQGHEIAVHSISHESNTDLWRHGSPDKWKTEMHGMRAMLGYFGHMPRKEIVGHRAPFLQTAGHVTFQMLAKEGFLYDTSMPTRNFMDPPIWPYTLDYGYFQDCQIEPCPNGTYPGLWEVPMIQYKLESSDGTSYCSMADACTPQPLTKEETKEYLMSNFLRHHETNKAPFPVFLHEAWLHDPQRLAGYLDFLDEIKEKYYGVFLVTIRDVIEYMKRPVKYSKFYSYEHEAPNICLGSKTCSYSKPLRNMKSCTTCPKYYPWVGTPHGRREPRFPEPE